MLKTQRLLGAILLIAGTTIGAGMLALPVITSFAGFFPALLLLVVTWLVMLTTAFFFLDVNLAVRGEPNLISMAKRTLGEFGRGMTWFFYLLLLYSLTAAYIAGIAPVFRHAMFFLTGMELPEEAFYFVLPFVFGSFVYLGTKSVDWVNRTLMAGLILAYGFLVVFVPQHITLQNLLHSDFPALKLAVTVVFTSFGFHIVIPSLVTYLEHDAKRLRSALIIGSAIPLFIYVMWQLIILGTVPLQDLSLAWSRGEAATVPLTEVLQNSVIAAAGQFFSFFAIVTSFLGVALSLTDFLADGLKLKRNWKGRIIATICTFTPPLFFVFTYKQGFYIALQHAGALVAILLGILPAMMAWTLKGHRFYRSTWGRVLLVAIMLISFIVVLFDFAT